MQQTFIGDRERLARPPPAPAGAGRAGGVQDGPASGRPRIRARNVRHSFDASIPRHWFGGNAVATQLANGVNLLFPYGERFFIRSVKHYAERLRDELDAEELARIRAFFGQEGHHAREHERFFEILEQQGYEIRPFLDRFERWCSALERRMSPVLRLAVTAAAEHFTATLAEAALANRFLGLAHPTMAALLLWHASEELEHKAVAYDMLQRVTPSYVVRAMGLAGGGVLLAGWWWAATRMLLRQDGLDRRERRRLRAQLRELREARGPRGGLRVTNPLRDVFLRGVREYLRPGFHPDDNDNYHLAREYLAGIGRAEA